jgi:hypothetical protein
MVHGSTLLLVSAYPLSGLFLYLTWMSFLHLHCAARPGGAMRLAENNKHRKASTGFLHTFGICATGKH